MTVYPGAWLARFSSGSDSFSLPSLLVVLALFTGLALPVPAAAKICAVDDAAAATLLLPYFEVSTTDLEGATTLFSVTNTTAEPTLVKMVLWSDLGIPGAEAIFYLTGFDVATFNLRDLFVHGRLPLTGHEVSNTGGDSFPSLPFPGCDAHTSDIFGGHFGESARQAFVDFFLGRPSIFIEGLCGATPRDDGLVTGYATFDVINRCEIGFPTDPGYFGPEGIASYGNRLIGDVFYVRPADDFAQGINLVRLEADPERFGPGDRTFYGPLVGGDGSDGREPLPTVWSARALDGGGFSGGTKLTVWRSVSERPEPFPCGEGLPEYPSVALIYGFDEDENSYQAFPFGTFFPPLTIEVAPFPRAVTHEDVRQAPLFFPFSFGLVVLDLSVDGIVRQQPDGSAVLEALEDPLAQAWVGATIEASGRFSVGQAASPLCNPCAPPPETPGPGGRWCSGSES